MHIDDCLINIVKNRYFTQLDLSKGFNQIMIDEQSKKTHHFF